MALVRELGEGSFFERYLAGAQSQAKELGIELIESNAQGDEAKLVANLENAIQQKVDGIIIDHGRADTLRPGGAESAGCRDQGGGLRLILESAAGARD